MSLFLMLRISLRLVGIISIKSFSCHKNSLKKGYTEMVNYFYFGTLWERPRSITSILLLATSNAPYFSAIKRVYDHIENDKLLKEKFGHFLRRLKIEIYISCITFAFLFVKQNFFPRIYKDEIKNVLNSISILSLTL